MPAIFWTGKLSPTWKALVNLSNLLAWLTGNARDQAAMKIRGKKGHEGEITDQQRVIAEMFRVLKPGETLAVAAHGTDLYREACERTFRTIPLKYILGYRVKFWPRNADDLTRYLLRAGLSEVQTKRLVWKDNYSDGGKVFDFFVSTSGAWWYAKFPLEVVDQISRKIRAAFVEKRVCEITSDVVLAYGKKAKKR